MGERIIGRVRRVNGPVIEASGIDDAMMLELVFVGEVRLVGEAIKLEGDRAIIQVYEDTTGIRPGVVYGVGRDQGLTSKTTVAILAAAAGRPGRPAGAR